MDNNIREYIILMLLKYKTNIAIVETFDMNNFIGLQAQRISDMPHSQTNLFNSTTENQALTEYPIEILKIKNDIKIVEIWLRALTEKEYFFVEQKYFYRATFNTLANKYPTYFTQNTWKNIKTDTFKKIEKIMKVGKIF